MEKIFLKYTIILLLVGIGACSKQDGIDNDLSFLNTAASANTAKIFDISNDNSGIVKITPTGDGVTSFTVTYGHGTGAGASSIVTPGGYTTHAYPEGSYTVTVEATDISGNKTSSSYPLTLTYRAPENLTVTTMSDMAIKATALYANSFLVYYGDTPNEVGTVMAVGQTLPAHIYPPDGPYVLKVIAQSGGAAKTEFSKTLFGLPLDFESPEMNYFFGTFGNVAFTKVPNPSATGLNLSATVGKYVKTVGANTWSGTYSPLNIPINFAHGNKIKVLVFNPDPANIGKKLNVELESRVTASGAPANGVAILKVPITTSGEWEELVFDFSTIAAIPATSRFGQLVLRFNDTEAGTGEIIYVDDFRITN